MSHPWRQPREDFIIPRPSQLQGTPFAGGSGSVLKVIGPHATQGSAVGEPGDPVRPGDDEDVPGLSTRAAAIGLIVLAAVLGAAVPILLAQLGP